MYVDPFHRDISDIIFKMRFLEELRKRKYDKSVGTIVTQVVVDKNDAGFQNPTKPIGAFYTKEEAEVLQRKKGYVMKEDAGRGYRRVVRFAKAH